MDTFVKADLNLPPLDEFIEQWRGFIGKKGVTRKTLVKKYYRMRQDVVWMNDTYQVNVTEDAAEDEDVHTPDHEMVRVIHLSIKRIDKEPIMDYRELMGIKDALLSEEHEAVQLFPARSREHDMANQYHLWSIVSRETNEPLFIPFGWDCGRRIEKVSKGGAKQRPFH